MPATTTAVSTGTQPPCMILVLLAKKNERSIRRNGTMTRTTATGCHFQTFHITTPSNATVTSITPETAMP